jgi:hypothetical protein
MLVIVLTIRSDEYKLGELMPENLVHEEINTGENGHTC